MFSKVLTNLIVLLASVQSIDVSGAPDEKNLAWPPVFLLGFTKTGTSSIATLLIQNPKIHPSLVHDPTPKDPIRNGRKETKFFNSPVRVELGPEYYRTLWANTTGSHVNLDATPLYVLGKCIPIMKDYFPGKEMKFIVVMREPIARLISSWHWSRHNLLYVPKFQNGPANKWPASYLRGHETLESLSRENLETLQGAKKIPEELLYSLNLNCYDTKLKLWLRHFPLESFCLLSSPYILDPSTTARAADQVSKFLGVYTPGINWEAKHVNTKRSNREYNKTTGELTDETQMRLYKYYKSRQCGIRAYDAVERHGYLGCGDAKHIAYLKQLRDALVDDE